MAESYYVEGITNWTKVLGDPVPNYNRDGHEWTFDFTVTPETREIFEQLGIADRIKNKGDERGDFFQFRQRAERRDGNKNRPITVVDAKNRPWPADRKIGNGSRIELKFNVVDYGPGKKSGVYPQAIRVLELVPYVRQEFAPLPEDNEFAMKADEINPGANPAPDFNKDFGLDD